jgi:hypothetical protein
LASDFCRLETMKLPGRIICAISPPVYSRKHWRRLLKPASAITRVSYGARHTLHTSSMRVW